MNDGGKHCGAGSESPCRAWKRYGVRRGKRVDRIDQGDGNGQHPRREEVVAVRPAESQLIPTSVEAVHAAAGIEIAYLIPQVARACDLDALRCNSFRRPAFERFHQGRCRRLYDVYTLALGDGVGKGQRPHRLGDRDAGAIEPGQRPDPRYPETPPRRKSARTSSSVA